MTTFSSLPPAKFIEAVNEALRVGGCQRRVGHLFVAKADEEERSETGTNWKVNGSLPDWPERWKNCLAAVVADMATKYNVAWPA